MARKKSARRKALEAQAKEQGESPAKVENKDKLGLEEESDEDINTLSINQEYAKRFEHNKSREEKHRQEEKDKAKLLEDSEEDAEDSSDDEDEDDFGELLTEDVDDGIQKVLETIRTNPKALLDPSVKFFDNSENAASANGNGTSKAMYLKDYHRQNLLSGGVHDDDEENDNEEKPYAIQNREDRAKLLAEINKDDEDEEDDGDFLTKRKEQRTIEAIELPDPEQDQKGFLEAYTSSKAWIPSGIDKKTGKEIVPAYGDIVGDEDDEEFDDIADDFETAYNFRYEDPNAAEIVSYARNESTLRRKGDNSRKRAREQKTELKKQEEQSKKAEVNKIKKKKVNEVLSKFEKLKEVIDDDETAAQFENMDLLEGDFDASEWDKRMEQVFNETFYSKKDKNFAGDDKADEEDKDDETKEEPDEPKENIKEAEDEEPERRSRKDKHEAKKEKQKMRQIAEQFVEANLDLALEQEKIDLVSSGTKFRYREVSPDSYGLTARDILLADDKDLNEFVGIKKLAPFRDEEKKKHDRRKYAKKRRLREWRKAVFSTEDEPTDELFEKLVASQDAGQPKKKKQRKR
ncbi:Kri1p [Sugiyamaella lignohabitans]|uniref:Kri1p n=1 Tax=Sugiyamaella lignohabitans TaxID=796027 RepID=A0A167EZU4_9ASCO|nr:Kri1p [Sugiyamaella lignohabitans]ANB14651.1 Kri1p [Sugiyamaella lignohabitans]